MNKVFDKITEKIIEGNLGHPVASLSTKRRNELQSIRDKIRSDPEQVELWFDEEIKKIEDLKINDLIKSVLGK
ncbi:MAG: hypothetical protein ACE5SW_05140 [Nitrososphaeraceae archaeon]